MHVVRRAGTDELLELVLDEVKTATSSLLAEYGWEGEMPPTPGAHTVLCDGSGTPRTIVRTVGLQIRRFDAVDAAHAWADGEGARSLAQWRSEHRTFWDRICSAAGTTFTTEMEVVLEQFEVMLPRHVSAGRRIGAAG